MNTKNNANKYKKDTFIHFTYLGVNIRVDASIYLDINVFNFYTDLINFWIVREFTLHFPQSQ